MQGRRVIFMDQSGLVKRRKVNWHVEFAQTEGKGPGAKKSFTPLYGASHVHGERGIALNAYWNICAEGQS
jgi:hypothetical protein